MRRSIKTYIQYATRSVLASYKVQGMYVILLFVFNTVCYGYLIFVEINFLWIL